MLPTLSLIVPAKNEEKVIKNCIDSLLATDYPKNKMEIIVAVDGSTDNTVKICKKYGKKIRLIMSEPKKCKAEAINEVLPLTKGEIIGIYDADCIVDKKCLKLAMKHFENKNVAGVSCALKSYNKNQNLLTKSLSIETCLLSFTEHYLCSKGANSIFFGKNMFIKKSVFDKIGNFDTTTYAEDSELSFRMRRAGYKIVFEHKAITWAEEPSDIKSFVRQRSRWARGYLRINKKHHYKSPRDFFSDMMHGIYYYISPFSLIFVTTILISLLILNIPFVFLTPLLMLLLFNVYLLIKSRIFFKESLKDLILIPLFLLIGNLFVAIMIKSWYDENTSKDMSWFRTERTGLILR